MLFRSPLPESLVKEWIDESYRHTAPKKLLKKLDAERGVVAPVVKKAKSKPKKR